MKHIRVWLNRRVVVSHVLFVAVLIVLLSQLPWIYVKLHTKAAIATESRSDTTLASVLENLRHNLEESNRGRLKSGDPASLQMQSIDLELNFIVKATSQADAKMSFHVVTAGTEWQQESEKVQKITIHMVPLETLQQVVPQRGLGGPEQRPALEKK
jgi:hypothetical protein